MAAPAQHGAVRKGADMPRNTPPHPANSGAGALATGLSTLKTHMGESHTEPSRASTGNENKGQ